MQYIKITKNTPIFYTVQVGLIFLTVQMEWRTLTNKMWHEDIYLNGYDGNIESKLEVVDWKTWTSECCGGTKLVPQVRWSSDKLIINITSSIAKLSLVKVLTGNLADLMFKYDFNFPEGKMFWFREEIKMSLSISKGVFVQIWTVIFYI